MDHDAATYAQDLAHGRPPVGHTECHDFPRCDRFGGHCGPLLVPDETTPTNVRDPQPEDVAHKLDEHAKRLRMVERHAGLTEERHAQAETASAIMRWQIALTLGGVIGLGAAVYMLIRYQDWLSDVVEEIVRTAKAPT